MIKSVIKSKKRLDVLISTVVGPCRALTSLVGTDSIIVKTSK